MQIRPLSRDELMQHRTWVRALARSLTPSAADADDVEQETWIAALRAPPRDPGTTRAWFAAVVRNAARRLRRGDARRRLREEAVTVPEPATPSAADLAARAEAHERVVHAVLALPDEQRDSILLRYFEGLTVQEIAARTKAPLETVRARLRRAREALRVRLDRDRDTAGRTAIILLVADTPTTGVGASLRSPCRVDLGGPSMSARMKLATVVATAVVVVAGITSWALLREDAPTAAEDEAAVPGDADGGLAAERAAPAQPGKATAPAGPRVPVADAARRPRARARLPEEVMAEILGRTRVSFAFDGAALEDVVQFLATATGVAVRVDAGVGPTRPVTLRVQNESLADVLPRVCALASDGIGFEVRADCAFVTRRR